MMRNIFAFLVFLASIHALAAPTKASKILISAHCPYATAAAVRIAEAGGNVVDVALTALITMSVTNPSFASLGGGGFAMVKVGRKVEALDFREVAPEETHPKYYLNLPKTASLYGGTAVGVPGLPAGIEELHKKYGKVHWSRLFDEAIRLAEKGFRVTGGWADDTERAMAQFNGHGKRYFLKKGNKPYKSGDFFRQPQLAKLLKEFRNRKSIAFYQGSVAKDIVNTVRATGGAMTENDLKNYKAKWREPITEKLRSYTVYLMPSPSSGGLVIRTGLRLLTPLGLEQAEPLSADEYHRMIELLKRSYRARSLLGDPDFSPSPLKKVFSRDYLEELISQFDPQKATDLSPIKESDETSHLSVMDIEGNAVALTMTVNGNYGSGVVTEKYGVVLNNEMDDFTTRPNEPNLYGLIQGQNNKVEAGKRPLSSMSPTVVTQGDKAVLVLGGRGGPRIISSVFQTMYRVLIKGDNIDQAIQAPRVHHQFLPNKVTIDEKKFAPEIVRILKDRGHLIETGWQGRIYGIHRNGDSLEGAFDSRGEGAVAGF